MIPSFLVVRLEGEIHSFLFKLPLKDSFLYCKCTTPTSLSIYRLNQDKLGGAWCPKNTIQKGIKEWIQIDLQRPHIITGVVTQVCAL